MKLEKTIIVECVEVLKAEVEKLNKKARKLGCQELTVTQSEPYMRVREESGVKLVDDVVDVIIEGEPIKLNGWRFIGRVEATQGSPENLIFTVHGEKTPEQYRTGSPYTCEHCGQNRPRKFTWVVGHEDGTYKQIGSSCMDDFLKARSPEKAVAWWMTSLDRLVAYLNALEQQTPKQPTGYTNSINAPVMLNAKSVLEVACATVRKQGRYVFSNEHTVGTPDLVYDSFFSRTFVEAEVEPQDVQLAADIIAYVARKVNDSGYFKNLAVMFSADRVSARNIRYISSAVYTYNKAQAAATAPAVKNEHFGKVGGKVVALELTVVYVKPIASYYHEGHDHLLILKDNEGRTFKWKKTSAGAPNRDARIKVCGTIKAHELYSGVKQTVLSHCTLKVLEAA